MTRYRQTMKIITIITVIKDTDGLHSFHGMLIAYCTHAATASVFVRLQLNLYHITCNPEYLLNLGLGHLVVHLSCQYKSTHAQITMQTTELHLQLVGLM